MFTQKEEKTAMDAGKKYIYVVDTNLLIYDPNSVNILRQGGNLVVIPLVVIFELDKLKRKPETAFDAREALRIIDNVYSSGDGSLDVADHPGSRFLKGLNKTNADHNVIATAKMVVSKRKEFGDFQEVKLISYDTPVRIIGRKWKVVIEDYRHSRVEMPAFTSPKEVQIESSNDNNPPAFIYRPEIHGDIDQHEGVICCLESGKHLPVILKGNKFCIIPETINAIGLPPLSYNGNGRNWSQFFALSLLLDLDINLVLLQGGAGTGKTLLATASAIATREKFKKIAITNPMVFVDDDDKIGYLPGELEQKITPWKAPVMECLEFLSDLGDNSTGGKETRNKRIISGILEKKKIVFEPLAYFRGRTFHRTFLIVDEAQNLTPHQVKTIITRAGENTKIVFTGDLGQIDRTRRIDKNTSGLAHAMNEMKGRPMVGTVNFHETVRSPLAKLAEELL